MKLKSLLKESALKSTITEDANVTVISDPKKVADYLKKYSSEYNLKRVGNTYDGTWKSINRNSIDVSTGAGPVVDMFVRLGLLGRSAQVLNDEGAKKELGSNIEGLKKYGINITEVNCQYTKSTKSNFYILFNISM